MTGLTFLYQTGEDLKTSSALDNQMEHSKNSHKGLDTNENNSDVTKNGESIQTWWKVETKRKIVKKADKTCLHSTSDNSILYVYIQTVVENIFLINRNQPGWAKYWSKIMFKNRLYCSHMNIKFNFSTTIPKCCVWCGHKNLNYQQKTIPTMKHGDGSIKI